MRFLIGLFVFALVSAPASAEERYSPWAGAETSVSAERGRLQGFVDRLNTLIDEGEKARAADPRFLRDLGIAVAVCGSIGRVSRPVFRELG